MFGPVGAAAISFALAASLIYMVRMRRAQGLPNDPVLMAVWAVIFLALSLAPWVYALAFDTRAPGDVFTAWAIGFPVGLVLGTVGGLLWVHAALKAHFPERYGQQ